MSMFETIGAAEYDPETYHPVSDDEVAAVLWGKPQQSNPWAAPNPDDHVPPASGDPADGPMQARWPGMRPATMVDAETTTESGLTYDTVAIIDHETHEPLWFGHSHADARTFASLNDIILKPWSTQ